MSTRTILPIVAANLTLVIAIPIVSACGDDAYDVFDESAREMQMREGEFENSLEPEVLEPGEIEEAEAQTDDTTVCGLYSCPEGTHAYERICWPQCTTSCVGNVVNASRCAQNAGTFWACGADCPEGWEIIDESRRSLCNPTTPMNVNNAVLCEPKPQPIQIHHICHEREYSDEVMCTAYATNGTHPLVWGEFKYTWEGDGLKYVLPKPPKTAARIQCGKTATLTVEDDAGRKKKEVFRARCNGAAGGHVK